MQGSRCGVSKSVGTCCQSRRVSMRAKPRARPPKRGVERTFAWLHNRRRLLVRTEPATTSTKASSPSPAASSAGDGWSCHGADEGFRARSVHCCEVRLLVCAVAEGFCARVTAAAQGGRVVDLVGVALGVKE